MKDQVFLEIDGELAILRLGSLGEKAVILNPDRMRSLEQALKDLGRQSIKSLVIMGGSPTMFCAGADINQIKGVSDPRVGEELARRGQDIFEALEKLNCKKIAAISGPCVGGGCELVLACDYRIITDHPSSKIGLPEIKLGILPGFGGTQRLPRVVGLPNALDIILKGKVIPGRDAYKIGLVDQVVGAKELGDEKDELKKFEAFEKFACKYAAGLPSGKAGSKIGIKDKFLTFNFLGRSIVKSKTEAALSKESRYPAPIRALKAALSGLQEGLDKGYAEERRLLGELIISSESKSLVHLFQVSEEAQKLGRALKGDWSSPQVTIVGGGTMGAGIAATSLMAGLATTLVEPMVEAMDRAKKHIARSLEKKRSLSEEQRERLLKSVKTVSQLSDLPVTSDKGVVIEAIVEDLSIKQLAFATIEPKLQGDQILATNTSSIPLGDLGSKLKDPSKFLGIHFFNPAERMPLIEVIRSKKTSDDSVLKGAAVAARLGKYPIVVEDVPGFLVNRILTPYLVEASVLLAEGYSVKEIDGAAEEFGMPMGPLRLLDEIGLDVAQKVSSILEAAYGERMRGHPFAERLAKKGYLGKKSGRGFYQHNEKGSEPVSSIRIDLGLDVGEKNNQFQIVDRLILSLVVEGIRCLDDGVAGIPGDGAAGQIDLGTTMGIGFPPYRGGVIWYAESLGSRALFQKLQAMHKVLGARFEPPSGLKDRAEKDAGFFGSAKTVH